MEEGRRLEPLEEVVLEVEAGQVNRQEVTPWNCHITAHFQSVAFWRAFAAAARQLRYPYMALQHQSTAGWESYICYNKHTAQTYRITATAGAFACTTRC